MQCYCIRLKNMMIAQTAWNTCNREVQYIQAHVHVYMCVQCNLGKTVHTHVHCMCVQCSMSLQRKPVVYNNNTSNSSQSTGRCWWVEHTEKHVQSLCGLDGKLETANGLCFIQWGVKDLPFCNSLQILLYICRGK